MLRLVEDDTAALRFQLAPFAMAGSRAVLENSSLISYIFLLSSRVRVFDNLIPRSKIVGTRVGAPIFSRVGWDKSESP
ncbi:MAG TPA: hypothetical protein VEO53_09950, partial [Candidatus Binatia bacterium]|nr:hypothetical protein [Candidatus Binatia bacterium]